MRSLVTIDVEGTLATDHHDSQDPYRSLDALETFLDAVDVPVTLFVTPGVVRHAPETVARWQGSQSTLGLHVHPSQLDGGDSDWLTDYDRSEIEGFVADGIETFEDCIGVDPRCFRAGRWAYSDRLLDALGAQGVERDASLRPSRATRPYERSGVTELPLTVWSNPPARMVLKRWNLEMVALHADAFLTSTALAAGFYGLTWRLIHSSEPYLMVSFHDYDLLEDSLRRRIRGYTSFVADRTDPVTLDEL